MSALFRVRRYETRWLLENNQGDLLDLAGAHQLAVWESLVITVSPTALPYVCYGNCVRFYEKGSTVEVGRAEFMDFCDVAPALLYVHGRWWERTGGKVIPRNGVWCMRHEFRDNTRASIEANAGHDTMQRRAAAVSN